MSQATFMGFPVKRIVRVFSERFSIDGKSDAPYEVRPINLNQIREMGDISKKTVYLFPNPPEDLKTGVFRILIIDD